MKHFENEKYLNAQIDFKSIVIRGSGTDLGDDAQYFLAESYYHKKKIRALNTTTQTYEHEYY